MQIAVISFTKRGAALSQRMKQQMERQTSHRLTLYTKCASLAGEQTTLSFVEEPLREWTETKFRQKTALIFLGACGIAVRAIAPFLQDKLTDVPVLVAEESGTYVIPILSGHYGGGNELAKQVAEALGASAVLTTATDVSHLFAVDVFARKNGLVIMEKEGIAKVSAKLLQQRQITLRVEGGVNGSVPPEVTLLSEEEALQKGADKPFADVLISPRKQGEALLWLCPKAAILGMGCRKGKSFEEIEAFVLEQLEKLHISMKGVKALATIDCKKEEAGFLQFAKVYGIEFLTYPKERLKALEGAFGVSDFVKKQVGVDNVCERAAVAALNGRDGELALQKTVQNGMTLAVVLEKWGVTFEEA